MERGRERGERNLPAPCLPPSIVLRSVLACHPKALGVMLTVGVLLCVAVPLASSAQVW